jgi:hypothetical protein
MRKPSVLATVALGAVAGLATAALTGDVTFAALSVVGVSVLVTGPASPAPGSRTRRRR